MALPLFPSVWLSDEHRALQDAVARFFKERWVPRAAEWRAAGMMGLDSWLEAGKPSQSACAAAFERATAASERQRQSG